MPADYEFVRGMLRPVVVYIEGMRHGGSEGSEIMRRDGELSDFVFEANGKRHTLHRFALQASGFFNQLFRHNPNLRRYTVEDFVRDTGCNLIWFFSEVFDVLYSGHAVIELAHASEFRKLLHLLRVKDLHRFYGLAPGNATVTGFGFTPDGLVAPAWEVPDLPALPNEDMAKRKAFFVAKKIREARENKENSPPTNSPQSRAAAASKQPTKNRGRKAYTPRRLGGNDGESPPAAPKRSAEAKASPAVAAAALEQPMHQEQIAAVDYSYGKKVAAVPVPAAAVDTPMSLSSSSGRELQSSPASLSEQATSVTSSSSSAAAPAKTSPNVNRAVVKPFPAAVVENVPSVPKADEAPLNLSTPPRLPAPPAALPPPPPPPPPPPLLPKPSPDAAAAPVVNALSPLPQAPGRGFPLWNAGHPALNTTQMNALAVANFYENRDRSLAAIRFLSSVGMASGLSIGGGPVQQQQQARAQPEHGGEAATGAADPGRVGQGKAPRRRRSDSKITFVMVNEKKMVQCNICQKILADPSSLYRHRKIHSKDKAHFCKFCDRDFIQRYNMTQHVKTHFKRKGSNSYMVNNCSGFIPFLNSPSFTDEENLYLHNVVTGAVGEDNTQSNVTNPFTRIRDGSRKRRAKNQEGTSSGDAASDPPHDEHENAEGGGGDDDYSHDDMDLEDGDGELVMDEGKEAAEMDESGRLAEQ